MIVTAAKDRVEAHKRRKNRPVLVGLSERKLFAGALLIVSLRHEAEHRTSGVVIELRLVTIHLVWLVLLLDVEVIRSLVLPQEFAVQDHVATQSFKSLRRAGRSGLRGGLAGPHGHFHGVAPRVIAAHHCLICSSCFGVALLDAHFLVDASGKVSRVRPIYALVPGFELQPILLQQLGLERLIATLFVADLRLGSRVLCIALETLAVLPFGRVALVVLSGYVFMRTRS